MAGLPQQGAGWAFILQLGKLIRTVPDTTLMRLWGWVALPRIAQDGGRGLGAIKGRTSWGQGQGRQGIYDHEQPASPEAACFKKIFVCCAGS